jgi:hypothetical protein
MGLLYTAARYGRFGVNIFDYSELSDFILAVFKHPLENALLLPVEESRTRSTYAPLLTPR